VELCAKHRKWLIQFSTCEVYGKTPAMLDPSLKDRPFILDADASPMVLGAIQAQRWTYACAKQLLERLVYSYGMERGLPFTIVRPFNFIGPRMDYIPQVDGEGVPRVIACFMEALLFNKPLKLVNGGANCRAFTDIRDAVDAIVKMLKRPEKAQGKIFNIGNPGNEITIRELAEKMMALYPEISGNPLPPNCVLEEVTGLDFYGPGYEDSDRRIPNIGPARSLLGWNPGISLVEAICYTMDGFIRQYATTGQKI
jgi:UDP-apiose/xylose synthase